MSVNYAVKLIDRTNSSNYHLFERGDDVAELSFGFTEPGGCAACAFTGALDDWSSLEDLMQSENFIEVYVNLTGGALPGTPAYTGIVQKVDGPKNTPPGRVARSMSAYGLSSELKDGGLIIFTAYENATVQAIAQGLVTSYIGPDTDISLSLLSITAGSGYTVPRTFFADIKASDCLDKLAGLAGPTGDVTWGVNASRNLYFAAKNAATVITLQLGDLDSGVTMARHEVGEPGPNALIVKGKEARAGNPMTIYETDIESGGRLRMKKLNAPSLIEGDDMVQWAQYKLATERDAPENITLDCVGIQDKTSSVLTASGQCAVLDENGGSIGTWPIKALTYTLRGGGFDAKFELGDKYEPDPSEQLRLLLQNTAVLDATEFSNTREMQEDADGFAENAQIHMAQYGIRNVVVYDLEGHLDLIDFDSSWTNGIRSDRSEAGLGSQLGGQSAATFATHPISMGKTYNTYCVLRQCVYPIYFRDDAAGDLSKRFEALSWNGAAATSGYTCSWVTREYGSAPDTIIEVRPLILGDGISHTYAGLLMRDNLRITDGIDFKLRFRWGEPAGGEGVCVRYLIFRYGSTDGSGNRKNYARVQMYKDGSTIRFGLYKYVGGVDSYVTTGASSTHSIAYSANDECLLTVDCSTYANWNGAVGLTLQNITKGTSVGPFWSGASALADLQDYYCGIGSWLANQNPGNGDYYLDTWGIRSLTFDNAVETGTMPEWKISRDGGESLDYPSINPDLPAWPQNMFTYAGPGTEQNSCIVRGTVIAPQILKKIAVGWMQTT